MRDTRRKPAVSQNPQGLRTPSRWRTWRRNPANWIALLTLIAVLVYTGVQIYQTILIRANNVASQRAFLYVGGFTPILATSRENNERMVRLLLTLTNGGNTPTKNLHFVVRCAPSVDALPEPWVLLYREKPEYTPLVIGPKATVTPPCDFAAPQLTDMTTGKLHGYVLAEIFYEDFLEPGTVHKTQYSQEYIDVKYTVNPEVLFGALIARGKHNCTDDDCPK